MLVWLMSLPKKAYSNHTNREKKVNEIIVCALKHARAQHTQFFPLTTQIQCVICMCFFPRNSEHKRKREEKK